MTTLYLSYKICRPNTHPASSFRSSARPSSNRTENVVKQSNWVRWHTPLEMVPLRTKSYATRWQRSSRWRDDAAEFGRRDRFTFDELRKQYPKLREPVIDGLIRRAKLPTLSRTQKSGKAGWPTGVLFAIVTGGDFLGKFKCSQGKGVADRQRIAPRKLVLPNQRSRQRIGTLPDEYEKLLEVWPLRGRLRNIGGVGERIGLHRQRPVSGDHCGTRNTDSEIHAATRTATRAKPSLRIWLTK